MTKEISEQDASKIRNALNLPEGAQLSVEEQPPHLRGADEMANPNKPQFEFHFNPDLSKFFTRFNISLIATAYKSNLVFAFGSVDDGRMSAYYSPLPHPMAIAYSPRQDVQELWISCGNYLVRFADAGGAYNEASEGSGGGGNFTASFVPRVLHHIGDQDVHGIYPRQQYGQPLFLSTKFSALCQIDSSKPDVTTNAVWKPSFISGLHAEDRCHLNSICFVDGVIKYALAVCESDALDGWRDHRQNGGVIINVQNDSILSRNISMPHSLSHYRGKLWVLESGSGHLCTVDESNGALTKHVWLPGFLRGLHFVDRYAIIGSSLDRHEARFRGLELGKMLEQKKTTPVCGFFVVDISSFSVIYKLEIKGNVHEMYDLALVPGRRARVIGLNDDESHKWFKVVYTEPQTNENNDENEEE